MKKNRQAKFSSDFQDVVRNECAVLIIALQFVCQACYTGSVKKRLKMFLMKFVSHWTLRDIAEKSVRKKLDIIIIKMLIIFLKLNLNLTKKGVFSWQLKLFILCFVVYLF
ncbi:hypothetical protein GMMP13_900005 [Candidatus Magnetomoraceae bacterium gMMP-13]